MAPGPVSRHARAGGTAALVAAEAAIRDPRFQRNYTREVLQSRAMLEKGLVRLGARHARAVVALPVTLRFEEPRVVQRMLRELGGGR